MSRRSCGGQVEKIFLRAKPSPPAILHSNKSSRIGSTALWMLGFGCKSTESYLFITTSFGEPLQVMVGIKIPGCLDRFFSNALCTNQAAFTPTIMYLVLCFLDTFLWYTIWNTVFRITRLFTLWPFRYERLGRIFTSVCRSGFMRSCSLRRIWRVKYKSKVGSTFHPLHL